MKQYILTTAVVVVLSYMFLPWLLTRVLRLGSYSNGKTRGKVAFTFDDGPDPEYTPALLDLLKEYGVKATFFVLGSRAEKYPELIRRIHAEGHEIGIHNYTHLSNWLMTPWSVKRNQIDRSAKIVESIIGVQPTLYRPPWGIINLFDFLLRKRLTIVLWSVMGHDWACASDEDERKLTEKLLRQIGDGSIVLLHDSGTTLGARMHAPKYMLGALRSVLVQLSPRSYEYVTVSAMILAEAAEQARCMTRTKRFVVALWLRWERFFTRAFRIMPIDENNTMLKLRVRKYSGDRDLHLEDGEIIRKGDRIAELHLDNELLFSMGSNAKSIMHLTVQIVRRMEQLMPKTTRLILEHPDFKDVKGLYGITIIHRGTAKFGFTVIDMPAGFFSALTKLYLRLLMYIIHPQGKDRLAVKQELLVPKIVAISKAQLRDRYIS